MRADVLAVVNVKEKNRKERQWANHLDFLAEACASVGWVEVVCIKM